LQNRSLSVDPQAITLINTAQKRVGSVWVGDDLPFLRIVTVNCPKLYGSALIYIRIIDIKQIARIARINVEPNGSALDLPRRRSFAQSQVTVRERKVSAVFFVGKIVGSFCYRNHWLVCLLFFAVLKTVLSAVFRVMIVVVAAERTTRAQKQIQGRNNQANENPESFHHMNLTNNIKCVARILSFLNKIPQESCEIESFFEKHECVF
jgi:hypothetical protein